MFCIGVRLINNTVIVSGGQWRDSAMHIRVSIRPQTLVPSRLTRLTGQCSMCSTVGFCWLSIKYSSVYVAFPKPLITPSPVFSWYVFFTLLLLPYLCSRQSSCSLLSYVLPLYVPTTISIVFALDSHLSSRVLNRRKIYLLYLSVLVYLLFLLPFIHFFRSGFHLVLFSLCLKDLF